MRKLNQTGSLLVFLTLGFALLGTFIGFAVDFGRAYLEKARVSRLIDGAALAAAKALKGQTAFQNVATQAACDSMTMNGAQVVWNAGAGTCTTTSGTLITATVSFFDMPVPGGPDIRAVRVDGTESVPTTFLRFLGWIAPGTYNSINVAARSEAGPERPVDLMLVLDRSSSMNVDDGTNTKRLAALKTAVNGFIGLSNSFSANDRIGMTSFAWRGCGDTATGYDSAAATCVPDFPLSFATTANISTLQSRVNALEYYRNPPVTGAANGGTNTMEALRVARVPLAAAFNDPTRSTTRKAVLLVTDGQPTYMRRDSSTECQTNPKSSPSFSGITTLPAPGNVAGPGTGCLHGVPSWSSTNTLPFMKRSDSFVPASIATIPNFPAATNANLYRDVIRCTRSLVGCVTNGAMYEANVTRNCGFGNSACASGGQHDIVLFAIGIGDPTFLTTPQHSIDANSKCMLARMANATDIVNISTGVVETMTAVCNARFTTTIDGDTHADLLEAWPCGTGPCIDTTQEKGKVYIVNPAGNIAAQLNTIFLDIASILKLRLVL